MRRLPLAAIAAVAVAAVGCSSSGSNAPATSAPQPSTPTSSTTTASSTPPPSPSTTTTSTAVESITPSKSTPTSSTARTPEPFVTTCTKLDIRVLPGGAVRGAEIAAVQYVNSGTTACTITGVPTAQLLRNGAEVGPESQPTRTAPRPFTLRPGEVGESLLQDFSTCNAPLSTDMRVTVPGRAGEPVTTKVEPVELRACTLRLAPVGRPS